MVPDENCGDLPDRIEIAPHAVLTVADEAPVTDGNSDAARRRRRAGKMLLDPAGIGQGKDGIRDHMAFAGVLHQIQYVISGSLVTQQDERGPIEDRTEFLAIVAFLERAERLREEDRVLAQDRIDTELIEPLFEIVILDEIGSACR